ncbi:MAG: pyrroloquinoline quinone biosynthesis protein PqqE [Alphaproteobacteria bacterium]|nr:MAG: pyrroloquinoline quinone biosynthesis protein PqqE [Alphaproteobacteria bacterium]
MDLILARDDRGAPEIFRSIQGEGPSVGRPRTFIRLSGCNLHCVWCDTAYTWNWLETPFAHERDAPDAPHKFNRVQEALRVEIADIAAMVAALPSEGVVITGGEPLMQRAALPALIDAMRVDQAALRIEIETNGSIAPPQDLADRVDLFVVSPKLAHSGNDAAVALRPEALAAYAALPAAVFKFVARTPADVAAAAGIARQYAIARARVYIMPEGTDSAVLDSRALLLSDAIIAHGFALSPRLHIALFGAARGV